MRKTKYYMKKKHKRRMKSKPIKRTMAAALAIMLVASVALTSAVRQTDAAENTDTLMGIEKLRNQYAEGGEYVILEVVPDKTAAEIGFLFDGYEPLLSVWDAEKQAWISWESQLLALSSADDRAEFIKDKTAQLKTYYEKMGIDLKDKDKMPVIFPGDNEPYDESAEPIEGYEEIQGDDYESMGYFVKADDGQGRYQLTFNSESNKINGRVYYLPTDRTIIDSREILEGKEDDRPVYTGTWYDNDFVYEYVGLLSECREQIEAGFNSDVLTGQGSEDSDTEDDETGDETAGGEVPDTDDSEENDTNVGNEGEEAGNGGEEGNAGGEEPVTDSGEGTGSNDDGNNNGDNNDSDNNNNDNNGSSENENTDTQNSEAGNDQVKASSKVGVRVYSALQGKWTKLVNLDADVSDEPGSQNQTGNDGGSSDDSGSGDTGNADSGSSDSGNADSGSSDDGNGSGNTDDGNSSGSADDGSNSENTDDGNSSGTEGDGTDSGNTDDGSDSESGTDGNDAENGDGSGSGEDGEGIDNTDDEDKSGEEDVEEIDDKNKNGKEKGGKKDSETVKKKKDINTRANDETYYFVEFERMTTAYYDSANPKPNYFYSVNEILASQSGQYNFVEDDSSEDAQMYTLPDKKIYCKGVFKNNEWFKHYVLNLGSDNYDNFKVKVITLTPDELNEMYKNKEVPAFNFLYLNSGLRGYEDIIGSNGNNSGNTEPDTGEEGNGQDNNGNDDDNKNEQNDDANAGDNGNGQIDDVNAGDNGSEQNDDANAGDNGSEQNGDVNAGDNGSEQNEDVNAGDSGSEQNGDVNAGDSGNAQNEDVNAGDSGNAQSDDVSAGDSGTVSAAAWTEYVSIAEPPVSTEPVNSDDKDTSNDEGTSDDNAQSDVAEETPNDNDTTDGADTSNGSDTTDGTDTSNGNDAADGTETPNGDEVTDGTESSEDEDATDGTKTPEDGDSVENEETDEDAEPSEDGDGTKDRKPPVYSGLAAGSKAAADEITVYAQGNSPLTDDVVKYLYNEVAMRAIPCLVDGALIYELNEAGVAVLRPANGGAADDTVQNPGLFRLALMLCQESVEADSSSVTNADLLKAIEDDDGNFTTDQVYCRFGDGTDSIINSDFFAYTFYQEKEDQQGEVVEGFQKVLDEIILENLYRESDSSGNFKPLPTNIGQAETVRHILNYENRRTTEPKKTVKVLDIEPALTSAEYGLSEEQVKKWAPGVENVEITRMTTAEFIGIIKKLNDDYDLIYIGTSKEHLNIKNWATNTERNKAGKFQGSTVFNDKEMDGLIYYNVGDKRVVELPLAGLLNTEYKNGNRNDWPYYYNFVRYSGNDITKEKMTDLISFLNGSYPVVVSDEFIEQPVTVFNDADYKGLRVSLPEGIYNMNELEDMGVPNDQISSMKVKDGYKVTIYQDWGYAGFQAEFTESVRNLAEHTEGRNGGTWDNDITSMKIEKIPDKTPFRVIDGDHIDNSSYMYEFVETALKEGYTNFYAQSDIEDDSELFKFYLNRPKASLADFETYAAQEHADITDAYYIYPNAAGRYTLQYSFTIKNEGAASMDTRYEGKLYIDVNADGKFSESEEVTDITMTNRQSGGVVSPDNLYAGVNYMITREVPNGYKGLLPWKVEVHQINNDNIYASETGYTKLQGLEQETLKICQINRGLIRGYGGIIPELMSST